MNKLLMVTVATEIFIYGVVVGVYQVFPFEQLKYAKQLVSGAGNAIS